MQNSNGKNKQDSWFIWILKSLTPKGKPKWLSWGSVLLSLWLVVYPVPREPLFIIVLAWPILGLAVNKFINGTFESMVVTSTEYGKDSHYIANFILFPGIALLARCFAYGCLNYPAVFEIGTIGFVLILILVFAVYGFVDKANAERVGIYVFIIPAIALYSYSAIYVINCEFDHSKPLIFEAKVVGKYSQTGKYSGYFLSLSGWEKHKGGDDIKVSYAKYKNTQTGQLVKVDYQKGVLNIPWYSYDVD